MRLQRELESYKSVRADSADDLSAVFTMRYEAYTAAAAIPPNDQRQFCDEYDTQPNCSSFLLFHDASPIASIRPCVHSKLFDWRHIPSQEVYSEDMRRHLGDGKTIVESNRFVFSPQFQKNSLLPKLVLFKSVARAAAEADADYIVTAVRPHHEEFYRNLEFYAISESKRYPRLDVDMILLACDYKKSFERVKQHPIFSLVLKIDKSK